jgi:hypothetical protein
MSNSVGVRADGTGGSGQIRVTVRDSVAAGNVNTGFASVSTDAFTRIQLANSTASSNGTGLLADGSQAALILTAVTSTANNTGISSVNSGQSFSYGNNFINGNVTVDGLPTTTISPQ